MIQTLLVFLFYFFTATAILVKHELLTKLQLQLGTKSTSSLPTLFKDFQYSQMQWFKKKQSNESSLLCEMVVLKEGTLNRTRSLNYVASGKATQEDIRDKIVYDLEEVLALRTFVDALVDNDLIYTIFRAGEGVIYKIQAKKGKLREAGRFTLTEQNRLDDALFFKVGNDVLLMTPLTAFKIDANGTPHQLDGYNQTGFAINQIRTIGNRIYVALGIGGLWIYDYDSQTNSLSLHQQITFVIRQTFRSSQQLIEFDVDQFDFDHQKRSLFILDYSQGLFEVPRENLKDHVEMILPSARLLVSNCRNLIVIFSHIYVTCPELIQLNRDLKQVDQFVHNTFYPYEMEVQNNRLLLYGRHNFAVYDLFGKVIDQYKLTTESEKSLMYQNYLITFSRFHVVFQQIQPQKQGFECYTKDANDIGEYYGQVRTEGLCLQIIEDIKYSGYQNQICTIQYPLQVTFKDSFILDLTIELYLFMAWLAITALLGISLAIKHYCQTRHYNLLHEEQFKELEEVASKEISVLPKKKREQLVQES